MSSFDFDVTTLEFDWATEPRILAGRFDALARSIDDFVPPLVATRQVIVDDVREHFVNEEGPNGPWQDWSPSYLPQALAENIGILRKTEALYDAATSITAYPIVGGDIFVNTNEFPDYWKVHQEGGSINSPRNIAKRVMHRRAGRDAEARIQGNVPARPYIWLSDEADMRIFEVFDGWMEGELQIFLSGQYSIAQSYTPGHFGGRIGLR